MGNAFLLIIVLYFWLTVIVGMSYKQILANYSYFLIVSLFSNFFMEKFFEFSKILGLTIFILALFYFAYLRKYIPFDEPVIKYLFSKTPLEEIYVLKEGGLYNGKYTKEIYTLCKDNKVIASPIFSYKDTKTHGYFLGEQFIIHNKSKDKISFHDSKEGMTIGEKRIFQQLETEKVEIMI